MSYEETLNELREWLEGSIMGARPINAAMLISIQESIRVRIARAYDVPMDWVTLTDVRFSDDRRNVICDGFTIWPGGLDSID